MLASKEAHAAGLKRRLGITAWREFSEDMQQGLKSLQESAAYKKTAEVANQAKERTQGLWSQATTSTVFQNVSGKANWAFGAAKSKISASMSHHSGFTEGGAEATPTNGAKAEADNGAKDGEPAKK